MSFKVRNIPVSELEDFLNTQEEGFDIVQVLDSPGSTDTVIVILYVDEIREEEFQEEMDKIRTTGKKATDELISAITTLSNILEHLSSVDTIQKLLKTEV